MLTRAFLPAGSSIMDSEVFLVRRQSNLQQLPAWLNGRRYTCSVYAARVKRRRDRVIALLDGGTLLAEVVVMKEALFPDALIAVLDGQHSNTGHPELADTTTFVRPLPSLRTRR
jgi:hypothetical protein